MRIEPYSDKYFSDVLKLVENFHRESLGQFDDLLNAEVLINTIKAEEKEAGGAFLIIIGERCEGILYGKVTPSPINKRLIFQEIMWYVNEPFRRYGIKLLKEVEKVLQSRGVSIIIMAVLENSKADKIKRFYERFGYKKMETHYIRSL